MNSAGMEDNKQSNIRRVVIVGGGTAGWITAAAISSAFPAGMVSIRLVESEAIGIIGVGEATLPHLRGFNRVIGVDEAEFMSATHATFKLGIEFVNWAREGDAYIHPFGQHGVSYRGVGFHHYWRKLADEPETGTIDGYSLPILAARMARFSLPSQDPKLVTSTYRYAYHFDSTLYAPFLRKHAEQRGVARTEGRVVGVNLDDESGDILSVRLETGKVVEGDLFVDCTGFRGLLIEEALDTGYESWAQWLPCDRAVAVQSDNAGPLLPHTLATAESCGWRWRIPLQHRLGNGHVYSSPFLDDDNATRTLLNNLEGERLTEPRILRFAAGKRKKMWNRNCVAIGLSGGFLEPLESTSIYLIQVAARYLVDLFPETRSFSEEQEEYNRILDNEFLRVRDFLILHYHATERSDSEFWNYVRTMDIPDSLKEKIDLFRARGRVARNAQGLFELPSWLAVFLGQHIIPESWDQRADLVNNNEIRHQLGQIKKALNNAAASMEDHAEFVRRHCKSAQANTA
jgi:tryptophan halogenase